MASPSRKRSLSQIDDSDHVRSAFHFPGLAGIAQMSNGSNTFPSLYPPLDVNAEPIFAYSPPKVAGNVLEGREFPFPPQSTPPQPNKRAKVQGSFTQTAQEDVFHETEILPQPQVHTTHSQLLQITPVPLSLPASHATQNARAQRVFQSQGREHETSPRDEKSIDELSQKHVAAATPPSDDALYSPATGEVLQSTTTHSPLSSNATLSTTPATQAQPPVPRISEGRRKAREWLNRVQWHGPAPSQEPDVEALKDKFLAAMDDWSGYVDDDKVLDRLLSERKDAVTDEEKICIAYALAEALLDLHNPSIGTKKFGKADPTTTNKEAAKERETLLEDRADDICEALRRSKKYIIDLVDAPHNIEYLILLAPKLALERRKKYMGGNDAKKPSARGAATTQATPQTSAQTNAQTSVAATSAAQGKTAFKRSMQSKATPRAITGKRRLEIVRETEKRSRAKKTKTSNDDQDNGDQAVTAFATSANVLSTTYDNTPRLLAGAETIEQPDHASAPWDSFNTSEAYQSLIPSTAPLQNFNLPPQDTSENTMRRPSPENNDPDFSHNGYLQSTPSPQMHFMNDEATKFNNATRHATDTQAHFPDAVRPRQALQPMYTQVYTHPNSLAGEPQPLYQQASHPVYNARGTYPAVPTNYSIQYPRNLSQNMQYGTAPYSATGLGTPSTSAFSGAYNGPIDPSSPTRNNYINNTNQTAPTESQKRARHQSTPSTILPR